MNVYLHRKSWGGIVFGASHYHGDLVWDGGTIIVGHQISERLAARLNQDNRGLQLGLHYRPGSWYSGFESPEKLTQAAIELFHERFEPDDVLFDGSRYKNPAVIETRRKPCLTISQTCSCKSN